MVIAFIPRRSLVINHAESVSVIIIDPIIRVVMIPTDHLDGDTDADTHLNV